tara:strand:- start:533 stop:991 length:459 start_codon:yes stop_codon:yes gene_type:complete
MFAKKSNRASFRSPRRGFKKNNGSYQSNRHRSRGNVTQLFDKYTKLAKEASSSGDRIQSEYYYQFADHYSRLMVEYEIKNHETGNLSISSNDELDLEKKQKNQISNESEKVIIEDKDEEKNLETDDELDGESIESVPFIAEPAKKKSSKIKK